MSKIKKIYNWIYDKYNSFFDLYLGAFAAQAAFFLILSFIPLIILIVSILNIAGIDLSVLKQDLSVYNISDVVQTYVNQLLEEVNTTGGYFIIFTIILSAWSSGKAFNALSQGFKYLMNIDERTNYFLKRLRGFIYSLLFALAIAFLALIGIFGQRIYIFLQDIYPIYNNEIYIFNIFRKIAVLIFFLLIILFVYLILPCSSLKEFKYIRKIKKKYYFLSAMFSSLCIYLYTGIFSLYTSSKFSLNKSYGGLTGLVCVMLWLYGCMYLILIAFKYAVVKNSVNINGNKK